jgi:hypothetical protein
MIEFFVGWVIISIVATLLILILINGQEGAR